MMCKNSVRFDHEISIEGLIGITVDRNEVFLVSIDEVFDRMDERSISSDDDEAEIVEISSQKDGSGDMSSRAAIDNIPEKNTKKQQKRKRSSIEEFDLSTPAKKMI